MIIGATIAGIAGAIFAIPTAAAIFSITDYLRQRDVLVRAGGDAGAAPAAPPSPAWAGDAGSVEA